MGRAHAKHRSEAQCLLQALWPGYGSGLEKLEERGFSPLFGCSLWCLRTQAFDVRFGLAGVFARGELSASARNHRRLHSGLLGGHQGKNLRWQCVRLLSTESGETWTCSLKIKLSSSQAVGRELALP